MSTNYSRPLKLAHHSTAAVAGLEERLHQTTVVVGCEDRSYLSTLSVVIGNLRRLPINLIISANAKGALAGPDLEYLIGLADDIDPDRPISVGENTATPTLRLCVGPQSRLADISAVPDGHGVRLRRPGRTFPSRIASSTGIGSVLAAAVLTAEAFKEIAGVHPYRQRRQESFDFNPVTLGADGPEFPFTAVEHSTLIGAGAIGTAIGLIFREAGVQGSLTVVDHEVFEDPNVATYSLGRRQDATQLLHKTKLLERELPKMDIYRVEGTAQDYIALLDHGESAMPQVVFGAVDGIEARHQISKIYAPLTLDGSTGGIAGTTVGLAEATPAGPCLRCYFAKLSQDPTPSAEQRLADETGLNIALLADGDHVLSTDDLNDLPAEGARLLSPHLGKPVCGLARTLGIAGAQDNYMPSAPFVSQQAAALVVGALIARSNGFNGRPRDLEYDALFGPDNSTLDYRRPDPTCSCQTDSALIGRVIDLRRARSRPTRKSSA